MKQISIYLSTSLIIVALIVGLAAGYFISPVYRQNMYETNQMGLGKADKYIDLRYIDKMITHHRGAILLADQITNLTRRTEIHNLADEIIKNEPVLIDELYSWKKEWYSDTKKVADPEVVNLGSMDEKVDLRFLNAFIAHHEEGIEMTKEIKTKSTRNEILNNADSVETFLTSSLEMLTNWRDSWYLN